MKLPISYSYDSNAIKIIEIYAAYPNIKNILFINAEYLSDILQINISGLVWC